MFNPKLNRYRQHLKEEANRETEMHLIPNRLEARGMRMARDKAAAVLREGVMTLSGSIILILIGSIESRDAALKLVPLDWTFSHGELATAGIV